MLIDKDIQPKFKHSAVGNFLFYICAKMTKFLTKARCLYYILACTWGILMTFAGLLITFVMGIAKIFYKKIEFEKFC